MFLKKLFARMTSRRGLWSRDTLPVALVTIACAATGWAQTQPAFSIVPAPKSCSLSGQSSEQGTFDRAEVEVVSNPTPFSMMGKEVDLSSYFIGRVVNLRPLFIEILSSTTNLAAAANQPARARPCDITRIFDVQDRLQNALPQLRFNDLVTGKSVYGKGGISKQILTELRKIAGAPPSLPGTSTGGCVNGTGTLLDYRGSTGTGDRVVVSNDLSIYYSNARGDVFDRQKLGQDDVDRLMQSFADSGFDTFPGRRWSTNDQEGGRATLTLICSRTQAVAVDDHRRALAPVLENLEHIKAVALANTSLVLSYRERRPITFIEWALSNIALDQVENLKHQADFEPYEARRLRRPVREVPGMSQLLPPDFLANLPAAGGPQGGEDRYVRSGARIFLVTRIPNPPAVRKGTIGELMVVEIPTPENARVSSALTGLMEQAGEPIDPDCAMWQGSVLRWPDGAETSLAQIQAAGKRITREEYGRHRILYEKIFNRCDGADLIEGSFLYRGVQFRHVENVTR
jgi:hypothetical protein